MIILFFISLIINSEASDKRNNEYVNKLMPNDVGMIIKFNRITLPIYDSGMIGNSVIPVYGYTAGIIDTNRFMSSSGFFISGINEKKQIWASGVYPSKRISFYDPGTIESGPNVQSLFYVTQKSEPFGQEWQNWREAVKLGAEFYDGDSDGYYDPRDKNSNGVWDYDEDKPAIYGDVMSWSAYNDGSYNETQGINIRQTIWSQNGNPDLDKVIFIKYSLENTGMISLKQDSVIFSIAVDSDLGDPQNDFLGTNVNTNEVFTYNQDQWYDEYLQDESISLITSLIQGPIIDSISKRSYQIESEDFNIITTINQKNQPIIATSKMRGFFDFANPEMVRAKMLGLDNSNPCSDYASRVYNVGCNS